MWEAHRGSSTCPRGMGLDSQGNVWVADTGNHRIQEFNQDGELTAVVGKGRFRSRRLPEPHRNSLFRQQDLCCG